MLGGGKWTAQNKILSGTYINFISKNTNKTGSNSGNNSLPQGYVFLMDSMGAYLMTSDGYYLAVKES